MTTELEKQFFSTFGIEPYDRYYNCKDNLEGECTIENTCDCCEQSEDVYCYPQITDRILLELICIINKHSDFGLFSSKIDELKDEILDHCLVLIGNDTDYTTGFEEEIKKQVQALFKE